MSSAERPCDQCGAVPKEGQRVYADATGFYCAACDPDDGRVRHLVEAATRLLHDFHPFGSAFEAKSPHSEDGETVGATIRAALLDLGVTPEQLDDGS